MRIAPANAKDTPLCNEPAGGAVGQVLSSLTTQSYDAVRTDPGAANYPIDAWNTCRWVDDVSTDASLFVPFKSIAEWQAFVANYPQSTLNLVHCALPWSVNVAPSTSQVVPPYPSAPAPDCSPATVNNPNVYGRSPPATALSTPSVWTEPAPLPIFTRHGNVAVNAKLQWKAGDSEPSGTFVTLA